MVDLHVHSTASDGEVAPADVVRQAAACGLSTIALTDHDTLTGVREAADAGDAVSVRVVAGCEFSVAADWGELHLLGYFLPLDDPTLRQFLDVQRTRRRRRLDQITERLTAMGVSVQSDAVEKVAGRAPVGRPHVARALVAAGHVASINEAFDRYLADGGPAAVPKELPTLAETLTLVRRLGGVTSAAHLRARGTRKNVQRLRTAGVDAVEVLHPAHDMGTASRLDALADDLELLKTGGSDWHGIDMEDPRRQLGGMRVPARWLEDLERLHRRRMES